MAEKKFDVLRVVGLRKKPKQKPKYATFNQRMMALTVDSFIVLIVFAPVFDAMLAPYFPVQPVNLTELQQSLGPDARFSQSMAMFFQAASDAGAMARWTANSLAQLFSLMIMSAIGMHFWGGSPGKIFMHQRVLDAKTETRITDKQIALRSLVYLIGIAPACLGFLWIAFDKKKQGWHDHAAGTVVVNIQFSWKDAFARAKAFVKKLSDKN